MVISTRDGLINAMANNSSRVIIDKASISNATAGQFHSLWRATGQPGQGAIPTTAATCDNTLAGALGFQQQTGPATSYLAILEALCANAGTTLEIHDRLMHMGGLSGTVTTSQTVGLNLHANIASDNLEARIGDSNYSDVQWWMEWFVDTGNAVATATIGVTYSDATTGTLSVSLAAQRRASLMIPLNSLLPAGTTGKFIRSIDSVTLSASIVTAGNFGFTATRYRAGLYLPLANSRFTADWAALGLPEIPNESCLFAVQLASTTTTGVVRATGKISHG